MLLIYTLKIIDWTLDIFLLNLKLVTSSRVSLASEYISAIFLLLLLDPGLGQVCQTLGSNETNPGTGAGGGLNLELSLILDWMPYQG